MSDIHAISVDERNYRMNGLLFKRLWQLTKPYWMRREAWPAWIVVALLIGSITAGTAVRTLATYKMKALTDALIAHERNAFVPALIGFVILTATGYVMPFVMTLFDAWMLADWRKWLSQGLIGAYLSRRTYYDIALKGDLDNPDQRLQESVEPLIRSIAEFPRQLIYPLSSIAASVGVLLTLDPQFVIGVTIYVIAQLTLSFLVTVPMIRLNFRWTVAEANLRYGLTHVRENAETIAFYHGETVEKKQIFTRLREAVRARLAIDYYAALASGLVFSLFTFGWVILPYAILSWRVLDGRMSFGSIAQAAAATQMLQMAIYGLQQFLPSIADAAPRAIRLSQIAERLEQVESDVGQDQQRMQIDRSANEVALENLTLQTPGGEQQLVRNLSLTVGTGENLVIVGQTGVGKSSLLRAMAGLWTRGEGRLRMPPPDQCLFLPQRPYMVIADMRAQLLYPHGGSATDDELLEVLSRVNLRDVVEKHGGLSAERDWSRVLSLGEQQRIGFARVLVAKPAFVFLDEATSAVDYATENALYSLLAATGAQYVSIGHRLGILDHHTHILTLKTGGTWSLEPQKSGDSPLDLTSKSDALA